jgi:hypothetical protein
MSIPTETNNCLLNHAKEGLVQHATIIPPRLSHHDEFFNIFYQAVELHVIES